MNQSLQKKTAARMAAIQYFYRESITGDTQDAAAYCELLKTRLSGNKPEQKLQVGTANEPNYTLLQAIINGVNERRDDIHARIDGALNENWKRERMSRLLVALLEASVFEMCFYKEVKHGIITDEYTKLARSFFDDKEVNFVHGLLANLAKSYE